MVILTKHLSSSNSEPNRSGPPHPRPAPPATADGLRLLTIIGLTAVLIALCLLLALPFFPALTWGVALAIMAWPMHRRIARIVPVPALAAALSTLVVVTVILAGGGFVAYQIALETSEVADQLPTQTADGGIRTTLEETPMVNQVVAWMDRVGVDVEAEIRKVVASFTQDLSGLAQGSFAAIIQFLVAAFVLYYLFLDRVWFMQALREFLPFSREECDQVTASAADSVHANLYATLVTSAIDTAGFGLIFWALGLPAPVVWTCVMFLLSLLPIVGAGLVWAPAVVYLALSGRYWGAAAILAWGLLTFVLVDNFLFARLVGQRMRLHAVPALISFLGGVAIFGVSGMILGPAIVAVTAAFIDLWKQRMQNPAGPAKSPPVEVAMARTSP